MAKLSGANLVEADLGGANLRDADLSKAKLGSADLRDADLSGSSLRDADLFGANLNHADLRSADLSGADLTLTDMGDVDLGRADLSGAELRDADLSGAYLGRANLGEASLNGASLTGAKLFRESLRGAFYDLDQLSDAIFLDEEPDVGEVIPPRGTLDRWMTNPARLCVYICGPRIANRHLFAVIGAMEHFYCAMFTMLHSQYENAEELNNALRSPFHEVPDDHLLAVESVRAGSIELFLGMPVAIGSALLALGKALKLRNAYLDGELKVRDVQLKDLEIQSKWLDLRKKERELKAAEKPHETAIQKVDNGVAFPPLSTDEGEHPSPIAMAIAGKYQRMELTPNLSQEECARVIDGGCDRIRRVMEYTEKNEVVIELELSDLEDVEDL